MSVGASDEAGGVTWETGVSDVNGFEGTGGRVWRSGREESDRGGCLRGAVCAFSSVHFACSVHFAFCSSPRPSHSAILFLNGTGTFPRHQKPILRDLFRPRGAVSRTPNKALEQQWKRVLPQNNFYLAPKHSV